MIAQQTPPTWSIQHLVGNRIVAKRSDHPEFQVILWATLLTESGKSVADASDEELRVFLEQMARQGKLWRLE